MVESASAREPSGWTSGKTTKSDRADWVRRFAEVLNPADPIEGLDLLQLQFLGDQSTARTALRSAFDEATTADDIPRCAALVQSLSSVWKFADPPSTALFEELRLDAAAGAQARWRTLDVTERVGLLRELARVLRAGKEKYARLITAEMGKPLAEAEAEIEKCAVTCEHYAEQAGAYLADRPIAAATAWSCTTRSASCWR